MVFTLKDMSFKAGMEMKITAKTKPGCDSFAINIGHDADAIALHFNPRFNSQGDTNTIVCNSKQGGWGAEHREPCFPFEQGEEFKLTISFNNETFYIKLPGGTMMSFPNRFGDDVFKHVHTAGDVRISSIKIN
ncbi:beta-galactoside-binding lectin-like protein [Labeo rohita]|uniref:Galectin n=2 Tax=Labeo rohita TaxID=84645 RepID=A0A498NLB5_LABRO|nr:lectin, galactoside-binding, soluble, 2b [Labeo rohita]RXN32504.1 beta-galactoside-binding lectin-like protein [Labeo rohita]